MTLRIPGFERVGFFRALWSAIREDEGGRYAREDWSGPRLIPDGYAIRPEDREAHVFEVEDTSKLSAEKLSAYGRLADILDYYTEWDLRLFVSDRYALHLAEIDLMAVWLAGLQRRAEKLRAERGR